MTFSFRRALLLSVAPVVILAQAPQPAPASAPMPWYAAISGSAGGTQRVESGQHENGSRLQFAYARVRPTDKVGTLALQELSLAFAQVNTTAGAYAVRENSIEIGAMADMVTMRDGVWHLDSGLGLILSRSLGCATDGSNTRAAGPVSCVHAFADNGITKIGARARLISRWSGPITTAFVGLDLTGNTVAAGKSLVPSFFLGARYTISDVWR
jgi:hypothetical protein